MSRKTLATFTCPNCGGEVSSNALACPHCGSDEQTGWSADTMYDDLDLPDPVDGSEHEVANTKALLWKVVAVGAVILILLLVLLGIW